MPVLGCVFVFFACGSFSLYGEARDAVPPVAAGSEPPAPQAVLSVSGKDGWRFLEKELKHLNTPKFWAASGEAPVADDPLPAILDFKRQLESAGIDLLVVPVPAKAAIYPEKLDPPVPVRPGATDQEFYKALEAQGIKVLDLTEPFLSGKSSAQLYCRQDSHWSPDGIAIAAKEIAARLNELPWVKEYPPTEFSPEVQTLEITGDLAPAGAPPERLDACRVVEAGSGAIVKPSKNSPIILLGDSHDLVFHAGGDMFAEGAGLPDMLAWELGFPLDVVAVKGSGATSARRNLARRKDNLAGKHLVIWCFSSREFTEGQGWAKVPVVKTGAAAQ